VSRTPQHASRRIARPIAAVSAALIAFSGFGMLPAASAEPLETPDREIAEGTWSSTTPTALRSTEFPADSARIDRDAPELSPAASPTVSGILEFRLSDTETEPVVDGLIRFWRETSPDLFEFTSQITSFGPNGEFATTVQQGTYRIEFITFDIVGGARTYWNGEPVFFAADELVLNDDINQNLGTVVISQRFIGYERIAGLDRFETAAALTATIFDGSTRAPVVYIVNAFGFADALSAGPAAAAQGGVILPVRATSIPQVIHDELTRLNPERIVIAGGTGVVSAAVETQLQSYVDSPTDVDRVAGPDRYATSRAIVLDAFGESDLSAIIFATGRNFPDALAAGPAASSYGAAVLLVDGSATSLPLATRTLMQSFDEPFAFLVGGTGAISSAMEDAIAAEVVGVEPPLRLSGADRIATANAINDYFFGSPNLYPDFAFIATSTGFADALAAGPVAAAYQAPLYLSAPSCLSAQTFFDIVDLLVTQIGVVGGTGVLNDRVIGGDFC